MESIIMNKIRAGIELATSTFQKHIASLKQHMVVLLALALTKCCEDLLVSFAREMYSSFYQQVVGGLVARAGWAQEAGGPSPRGLDNAMGELSEIIE